jgi:hypothetical protein
MSGATRCSVNVTVENVSDTMQCAAMAPVIGKHVKREAIGSFANADVRL